MINTQKRINRVQIEGFKSIQSLDLEMRPINILIGANGSGKSNFISLFAFLRSLFEEKLQIYVKDNGFADTFFHFGSKQTGRIMIEVNIGNNIYHVEFKHGEENDTLIFDNERYKFTDPIKNSPAEFYTRESSNESFFQNIFNKENEDIREYHQRYINSHRVYQFHDTSPTAAFKKPQKLSLSAYLQRDARNLAPFLFHLQQHWQDSYQRIVYAIQTIAPFFHDFYLVPQDDESIILRWIHRKHETQFSADRLSDGTARFICMATLFLQPDRLRPKTIFLDDLELGLHHTALVVLADIIKSISKETQVVCSTQSVTFANHFEPAVFIVVDQESGTSQFRRLDNRKDLDIWLEDYQMGDIWMKNLIGGKPKW